MNLHYILKNKKPVPCRNIQEWAEWMSYHPEEKRVGYDIVNGKRISTVFLGLDHNFYFFESNEPILFETMVFEGDSFNNELYMNRCSTWDEAERQHKETIELVKKGEI